MTGRKILACLALGTTLCANAMTGTATEEGRSQNSTASAQDRRNDPKVQKREPFQIFDNLYYIGIEWVAAYLLTTRDGLILIDSLYDPFVDHAVDGIRKLGFDPKDVRYVFVTHGHFDHAGGAKKIQGLSGARVGMTGADWDMLGKAEGARGVEFPERDLVLRDGDLIQLGDTSIRFYVTPGHTPGVLSLEFEVRDGTQSYNAFTFGVVGMNFTGVDRARMYIQSVQRLLRIPDISVNLPNHPFMGQVFERKEKLAERQPGEPHPFVAPADFREWLEQRLALGKEKLEKERESVQNER